MGHTFIRRFECDYCSGTIEFFEHDESNPEGWYVATICPVGKGMNKGQTVYACTNCLPKFKPLFSVLK